jgi:hypothetical protein
MLEYSLRIRKYHNVPGGMPIPSSMPTPLTIECEVLWQIYPTVADILILDAAFGILPCERFERPCHLRAGPKSAGNQSSRYYTGSSLHSTFSNLFVVYAHFCFRPRTLAGSRALALPMDTLQSGGRGKTTVSRFRLTIKRFFR